MQPQTPSSHPASEPGRSPALRRLRAGVLVIAAVALVEIVLELGIVGVAWQVGRDHRSVAQRLHLVRFVFRPLPPPEHPVERSPGIRYPGEFLGGEPTPRALFPADGLLGHRLGCNIAVTTYGSWQIANDQCFSYSGGPLQHFERRKPPEVFRIIMLGGSTVEGVGAESPTQNLPGQLRRLLGERATRVGLTAHERVEVINAGVAGYHSGLEYLSLLVDLVDYQPDLVIFYDGWNDSRRSIALAAEPDQGAFRDSTHRLNAQRVNDSYRVGGALRHLGLAVAVESALFLQRTAVGFAVRELVEDYFIISPMEEVAPSDAVTSARFYGQNIELAIGLARQRGFAIAAFLQPLIGVDGRARPDELSLINSDMTERRSLFYRHAREGLGRLRSEYAGEDVCVADISESALRGAEGPVYKDWGHLLGAGNTAVAETIISELVRCALLP